MDRSRLYTVVGATLAFVALFGVLWYVQQAGLAPLLRTQVSSPFGGQITTAPEYTGAVGITEMIDECPANEEPPPPEPSEPPEPTPAPCSNICTGEIPKTLTLTVEGLEPGADCAGTCTGDDLGSARTLHLNERPLGSPDYCEWRSESTSIVGGPLCSAVTPVDGLQTSLSAQGGTYGVYEQPDNRVHNALLQAHVTGHSSNGSWDASYSTELTGPVVAKDNVQPPPCNALFSKELTLRDDPGSASQCNFSQSKVRLSANLGQTTLSGARVAGEMCEEVAEGPAPRSYTRLDIVDIPSIKHYINGTSAKDIISAICDPQRWPEECRGSRGCVVREMEDILTTPIQGTVRQTNDAEGYAFSSTEGRPSAYPVATNDTARAFLTPHVMELSEGDVEKLKDLSWTTLHRIKMVLAADRELVAEIYDVYNRRTENYFNVIQNPDRLVSDPFSFINAYPAPRTTEHARQFLTALLQTAFKEHGDAEQLELRDILAQDKAARREVQLAYDFPDISCREHLEEPPAELDLRRIVPPASAVRDAGIKGRWNVGESFCDGDMEYCAYTVDVEEDALGDDVVTLETYSSDALQFKEWRATKNGKDFAPFHGSTDTFIEFTIENNTRYEFTAVFDDTTAAKLNLKREVPPGIDVKDTAILGEDGVVGGVFGGPLGLDCKDQQENCEYYVPNSREVSLSAISNNPELQFKEWRATKNGERFVPCDGSTDATCEFTVEEKATYDVLAVFKLHDVRVVVYTVLTNGPMSEALAKHVNASISSDSKSHMGECRVEGNFYICSAWAQVADTVTLRAHLSKAAQNAGIFFRTWQPVDSSRSCPCTTQERTCSYTADQDTRCVAIYDLIRVVPETRSVFVPMAAKLNKPGGLYEGVVVEFDVTAYADNADNIETFEVAEFGWGWFDPDASSFIPKEIKPGNSITKTFRGILRPDMVDLLTTTKHELKDQISFYAVRKGGHRAQADVELLRPEGEGSRNDPSETESETNNQDDTNKSEVNDQTLDNEIDFSELGNSQVSLDELSLDFSGDDSDILDTPQTAGEPGGTLVGRMVSYTRQAVSNWWQAVVVVARAVGSSLGVSN